jgi:L-fuculose-phosphate aldolase
MALVGGSRRVGDGVVEAAREMVRLGLVTGTVGNVSARTPSGFAITPTRTPYERMRRRDLVALDPAGAVVGTGTPSREWPLHAAVYAARDDVGAVVHTHSLHATAWSFRGGTELPELEELRYHGIGAVAVCPFAPAGSGALARFVAEGLGQGSAVLLGEHGVVAVGATPRQALTTAIVVERQATIAWLLEGATVLSA